MTSDERLRVLRDAKHSVGASRFEEASEFVPNLQHARVFSSKSGTDTTDNPEIKRLLEAGSSVFASFKSTNASEVQDRADFLGSFNLEPGQWIIDTHYHEPEDLSETPNGIEAWLDRQIQFSEITHATAPKVIWSVTFTGDPGLVYNPDKGERHIFEFLPPGEYPWLDLIGVDRYIHDVKRRPPSVAWGPVLSTCAAYNRPLFIAEFGVEGTAKERSDYVAAHAAYVADQRRPGNKGKRILGSTWFHSPVGPQAPLVYDGTRTWAINKASDKEDVQTPAAWQKFASFYGAT